MTCVTSPVMEVVAVFDLGISLVQGLMLGIEFPPLMEIDGDIQFAMVVDILVFRLTLVKWKTNT